MSFPGRLLKYSNYHWCDDGHPMNGNSAPESGRSELRPPPGTVHLGTGEKLKF